MKTVKQAYTDIFTAIAHPVRRELLDMLAGGDQSVNQLAAHFSVTRPAISQHLRVLLDAGLVAERRQGRERVYSLRAQPLQALDHWLDTYRHLWNTRLDRLDKYLHDLQTKESSDEPT